VAYAPVAPVAPPAVAPSPQVADLGPIIAPAPSPVAPAPVAPAPVVVVGDSYGFGAMLNAARAHRGLRPLAYNPGLAASALANSARGFGHHHRGYGRGQVVGVGSPASALGQWLASGAHARILLDPQATSYGVGMAGGVVTVDVN
jgi:uncharacterized protein YkwD